jgi:hypothetical protein
MLHSDILPEHDCGGELIELPSGAAFSHTATLTPLDEFLALKSGACPINLLFPSTCRF